MIAIPGYRIVRQLYQGNRTAVYQGQGLDDKKPVVIKTLLADCLTPENIGTLRHEYEMTKSLNLKGVVKSYGLVSADCGPALILEDFGGSPLKSAITPDGMRLDVFLNMAIQVAQALGELHQSHIIHKDIKPSNILINSHTGQVKITDLGISSRLEREYHPEALQGSLAYMSPEQTGRMNRSVDYRTDHYSVGITLYEAITGQHPFQAFDPMEWVHCHIARIPVSPRHLKPEIPEVVSEIIMKLLSKTVEERYKSAYGLKADLEKCRTALHSTGNIGRFRIGDDDISDKFQISQKLYGREYEITTLMDAFDRVINGRSEMVVVSGYSGIGKSSIVREVHKPIVKHRGYFISGKFDQSQRNVPYACLIQAFRELVRQLLTESEESLAQWRKRLTQALDQNGQVIIDVIQEVQLIMDKQPPVQELSPSESQNRFKLVFQNFINVFAQQEHPLVIFIDDLQWADLASLKLIMEVIADADSRHLLLIGAYRDNEVDDAHPFIQVLIDIRKAGAVVHRISLGPLNAAQVNQLISDTLECRSDLSQPLAELIARRTGGNPLFVNEFLRTLYEESLLKFDAGLRGWRWDLDLIRKKKIPEDMVELLIAKIQGLMVDAQKTIGLAACIGNQFDLKTLALVNEKSQHETAVDLWEAIQKGFISSNSRFGIEGWEEDGASTNVVFSFIHDRVQQAALSLNEEGVRKQIHYRIGRLILRNTAPNDMEERVFEVVNHLNYARELILDAQEKSKLAELNLLAGGKAIASNAYEAALKCLTAGVELLPENNWRTRYEITSALYLKRLKCEYLCGNFDRAERLFDECLHNVKSPQEKADIYNIRIIQYAHQGKYKDSVAAGREALKMFGMYIPDRPSRAWILGEYTKSLLLRIARRLKDGMHVEDLFHLPEMSDPNQLAIMSILNNLPAPSYYLDNKNMFALVNLKMLNTSLRYGNTNVSSFSYATYGMLLSGVFNSIDTGYKFGELALKLNEKYSNIALKNKPPFVFYTFVTHWKKPAAFDIDFLKEAFHLSLKCGDLVYASNTLLSIMIKTIALGVPLDGVLKEANACLDFLGRIKDMDSHRSVRVTKQMVLCLKGLTRDPTSFSDGDYDEAAEIRVMEEKRTIPLHWYYLYKMHTLFILGRSAEALKMAMQSDGMLETSLGLIYLSDHYMYYSLALTSLYPAAARRDKLKYLLLLVRNRRKLKKWSDHCPENFQHKHLIVAAEIARLLGREGDAARFYEQASQSARENDYIQNEAICNELAAGFYLARGIAASAKAYLVKAYDGYERWGAAAKVKTLEERYAKWLREPDTTEQVQKTETRQTPSSSDGGESLDMMSVIKASQAISREIHLSGLLQKLMKIVIENAGAERGVLILERKGGFSIEAEGTAESDEPTVLLSLPVEGSRTLATSVVYYAIRTQEAVVLDNAVADPMFAHDPYIMERGAKSILCTPIINQSRLTGILYLENNLTSHAFTPKRVGILEALSSQIAISLENVRLYEETSRMNKSLQESEHKFRTLAETMRAAVLIVQEERFLYANPAVESITGYGRDAVFAMDLSGIIHPDDLGMVRERALARLQGKPAPAQYEFRIVRKSGETRWLMGTFGLIEYEGKSAVISTLLDITDYKESEEDRERLYKENVRNYQEKIDEEKKHQREKEMVLMDIHDGIGGITTNIRLLAETAQKALSRADVNRALTTISDLSREGMSEIRSLMRSLDSQDISWQALLAEMKIQGSLTLEPHNIAFEMVSKVEGDIGEPRTLQYMNLFRVYREALTNIIKHAKAKKVMVELNVGGECFTLAIRDDGQGCGKNAFSGNGRGMSNMKARVAELGGTITITAEAGTCVTVEIPLPS